MRTTLIIAALAGLFGGRAFAVEQSAGQLAWLAGCWKGDPGTFEQWMPPSAGTMLGMSRTIKQGKTVAFEFMQVRQLSDGNLAFIAQPDGRPPVTFRLSRITPAEVTFENLEHDYPQRITYARPDETHMLARIEGSRAGNTRKVEFRFERVSCDALVND